MPSEFKAGRTVRLKKEYVERYGEAYPYMIKGVKIERIVSSLWASESRVEPVGHAGHEWPMELLELVPTARPRTVKVNLQLIGPKGELIYDTKI